MQLKFSLLLLMLVLGSTSLSQVFPVTFTVTFLKPYCGGARPTQEMEELAQTPQPYANKTFRLANSKGKRIKLKTDAAGVVSCSLKAGEYKLFENWRSCQKTPDGTSRKRYDKACLNEEWRKEFATLSINNSSSDYKITNDIVEYCESAIPCLLESFRAQPRE